MKKKNVVTLFALLAMAGGLVGCGDKESESKLTENRPTEKVTETGTGTSESTTPDPEPTPDYDNLAPDLTNDPIPAPSKDVVEEENLAEGAEVRDYQSASDQMVNDFSLAPAESTMTGKTTAVAAPYLHVRVNTANDNAPISDDASIYKAATGSYDIDKGYSIGFRMKLSDAKTIGNDHLVLALRGSDSYKTFPIAFSKAKDPDGEALPTLTEEYQDFVISPMATIENENTPYSTNDGGYSDLKVLDEILGFHLYAAGNADCSIDIAEVFLRKEGADDIVLDNFEHAKPNDSDPNLYWRDSVGTIIGRSVTVKENGTFTQEFTNEANMGNIVLGIKGDTTGTKISFVNGENTITKNWSELKDSQNNAVVSPLVRSYSSLVINLENSGVTNHPTSLVITSSTEVTIHQIFLSDLVTKEAESYPVIDEANRKVFDDFNRNQTGINGDYAASNASEIVKKAGLDYVLSYSNGDKVTIDGNAAVFDASSLAANDQIQLKVGSDKHQRSNEDYLVIAAKMEDGATLDGFRFVDANNSPIFANTWKAGYGVSSLDTPYTKENGYSLYVIDLEETGAKITNTLDMYYSGTGKLSIDEIFFANDYIEIEPKGEKTTLNKSGDLTGYFGIGFSTDAPVVALELKGDGEKATLHSIRFAYAGGDIKYIRKGEVFDQYGHALDMDHVISKDGEVFYISIEASGWNYDGTAKEFYVHAGADEGSEGTLEIVSLTGYQAKQREYALTLAATTTIANGYTYLGWLGNKRTDDDEVYLKLVVKGDGKATLDKLRIINGSGEYWINTDNNAVRHQLYMEDGNVRTPGKAVAAEGETIIINLSASGVVIDGSAHLHYEDDKGGVLTLESMSILAYTPTYNAVYESVYHA